MRFGRLHTSPCSGLIQWPEQGSEQRIRIINAHSQRSARQLSGKKTQVLCLLSRVPKIGDVAEVKPAVYAQLVFIERKYNMPRAANELSQIHGPSLPAQVRSAWDFFEQTVHEYPDSLALVSVCQPHDLFDIHSIPLNEGDHDAQYLRWTYKSLRCGITCLVSGFRALGIEPGTLIFTFVHNCAEFVLTK